VKHTCLTNQNFNLKQFVNHFTPPGVWCLVNGIIAPRISKRTKLRTDDKCHLPLAVHSTRSFQAKTQFQDRNRKDRCLNAWVAEGMQGVVDLMAERGWEVWARFTKRGVAVQLD